MNHRPNYNKNLTRFIHNFFVGISSAPAKSGRDLSINGISNLVTPLADKFFYFRLQILDCGFINKGQLSAFGPLWCKKLLHDEEKWAFLRFYL
jgi:hypothetical protein